MQKTNSAAGVFVPITTPLSEMSFDWSSTVLLAYASQDPMGQIVVMNNGTIVSTCRWNFVSNNSPREIARWKAAVELLQHWGLIKWVGRKDKICEVTDKGHQMAEVIILDNEIDVHNSPEEYLKDMG